MEGIAQRVWGRKFHTPAFPILVRTGTVPAIQTVGLKAYDEVQGIKWSWLSADDSWPKRHWTREEDPTGREENRSKRPILTDREPVEKEYNNIKAFLKLQLLGKLPRI
jgi:hypothetical protein